MGTQEAHSFSIGDGLALAVTGRCALSAQVIRWVLTLKILKARMRLARREEVELATYQN